MNYTKPSTHPRLFGPLLALALITALPASPVFAEAPCCSIVGIDRAAGIVTLLALALITTLPATQVFAATPCCSIVGIDKAAGIVTLRDSKTGHLEKVTVKDPAQLAKLTVRQTADRSIGQH
jgi:hypothetical protein